MMGPRVVQIALLIVRLHHYLCGASASTTTINPPTTGYRIDGGVEAKKEFPRTALGRNSTHLTPGPCNHSHICTATCVDIGHLKRAIELTSSSEAKRLLEDEIEGLRCENLTLDEVFRVSQVVEKKYCCREDREEMEEGFCDLQQNTFVDAWSKWSPCSANGVKERTRRCYLRSREGSFPFGLSSHPCHQRTLETELCNLLVVGGHGNDGPLDTVEWLPANNTLPNEFRTPGKFPTKIRGAVGATLTGTPHVCGGRDEGFRMRHECWFYDAHEDGWRVAGRLRVARWWSAAAYHPNHGLVITGGRGPISSAERITNDGTFSTFTPLPIALWGHCMVSLNRSDIGDFFLAGGVKSDWSDTSSGRAFIYKNSKWVAVADMPTARYGLACGPLRGTDSGAVEKVVAIGGWDGSEYLSKVEVYDVASSTWTNGTNLLPMPIAFAAVVPFEDTFLVIGAGGKSSNSVRSDKVYRYNRPDGSWTEIRKLRLNEPKHSVTAMWFS